MPRNGWTSSLPEVFQNYQQPQASMALCSRWNSHKKGDYGVHRRNEAQKTNSSDQVLQMQAVYRQAESNEPLSFKRAHHNREKTLKVILTKMKNNHSFTLQPTIVTYTVCTKFNWVCILNAVRQATELEEGLKLSDPFRSCTNVFGITSCNLPTVDDLTVVSKGRVKRQFLSRWKFVK